LNNKRDHGRRNDRRDEEFFRGNPRDFFGNRAYDNERFYRECDKNFDMMFP
jgi:hypothetical protein